MFPFVGRAHQKKALIKILERRKKKEFTSESTFFGLLHVLNLLLFPKWNLLQVNMQWSAGRSKKSCLGRMKVVTMLICTLFWHFEVSGMKGFWVI